MICFQCRRLQAHIKSETHFIFIMPESLATFTGKVKLKTSVKFPYASHFHPEVVWNRHWSLSRFFLIVTVQVGFCQSVTRSKTCTKPLRSSKRFLGTPVNLGEDQAIWAIWCVDLQTMLSPPQDYRIPTGSILFWLGTFGFYFCLLWSVLGGACGEGATEGACPPRDNGPSSNGLRISFGTNVRAEH